MNIHGKGKYLTIEQLKSIDQRIKKSNDRLTAIATKLYGNNPTDDVE